MVLARTRSHYIYTPLLLFSYRITVPIPCSQPHAVKSERAFLISCPTRVRFGVQRSVRRSVRPLNACPPEGPEALQACSLFQGTKAWLEPRLEPAETHPGAPVSEKRRSGTSKHCFAERFRRTRFDEQGVNKRPQRGLQGVQRAATRPKWAAEHCLAAWSRLIAPLDQLQPVFGCGFRRRGATVNGSPQHRRSSAAIEDWPIQGCCASPGTARTWRTTLQASCSDSVRLGVQRHGQGRVQEVPGGGSRVQRRQRALNRPPAA